jgi:hypothetical protein
LHLFEGPPLVRQPFNFQKCARSDLVHDRIRLEFIKCSKKQKRFYQIVLLIKLSVVYE